MRVTFIRCATVLPKEPLGDVELLSLVREDSTGQYLIVNLGPIGPSGGTISEVVRRVRSFETVTTDLTVDRMYTGYELYAAAFKVWKTMVRPDQELVQDPDPTVFVAPDPSVAARRSVWDDSDEAFKLRGRVITR